MNRTLIAFISIVGSTLLATTAAAATCESLKSLSIQKVTIVSAESVPAGAFVQPGRGGAAPAPQQPARGGGAGAPAAQPIPAHCRVKMILKPSTDSNINAELWLPAADWNGKFLAVGNGGFGGAIQGYNDMQVALRRGYATAGNDTGHSEADGPNGMFGLGHPEKIVDFSHRAMHEMVVTSKRLVDEFYGKMPQFSYYKGCSTGGRQGVMAAQRFPEDFDGIIAGALANRHIHQHTAGVTRSIELARHPEAALTQEKADLVSKALLNACDTAKEGFVNNPRACSFDFTKLACSGEDTASCLTAPQLKTVQTFYGGVKNSKGELIFSGQALSNPIPALRPPTDVPGGGYDTVRIWAFQKADYDWKTFDLDRDMPIIESKVGFVDAVDPDLTKFKAHGGKLLLYAGWGDTTITPENTVMYYESVVDKMGKKQTDFTRLFMVPGMAHCGGGVGPNTFDSIGTLEAWREKGAAPSEITAFNPQTGLSRPLCPYPQFAKYTGTGNMKDAANWKCTAP
jgi:Tannase and feruloyl esterase